jgi:hypothetical protein
LISGLLFRLNVRETSSIEFFLAEICGEMKMISIRLFANPRAADFIASTGNSRRFNGIRATALLLFSIAAVNAVAQAPITLTDVEAGLLCPGEFGALNCTANDVSIASITPDPAVTQCNIGEDFTVGLVATIQLNSQAARRDVGIWISETEGDPTVDTVDDSSSCLVATFPNSGVTGFGAAADENPADACGDALVKGTVVEVDLGDITLPCIPDANGDLVIQPVVTWVIDKTFRCEGAIGQVGNDFFPVRPGAQASKCEAGPVVLDIQVVVPPATLTLEKEVNNNFGGTAANTAWTLSADGDGANDISGSHGDASVTDQDVEPGSFLLSESGGPGGYVLGGIACEITGDGSLNGATLTLESGDVATCTFTNNDVPAGLTVTKVITSDNGGTATLDDFNVSVDTTEVTWPDPTATDTGTAAQVTQDIGDHTLSEADLAGYAEGDWSCVDDSQQAVTVTPSTNNFAGAVVNLGAGDLVICTITNNDIAPTLTLEKTVVSNFGGSATEDDFQARIDGDPVDWDAATAVSAGVAHIASETGSVFGYSASSWGGACAPDGSVTLALGQNATCNITNTQDAPEVEPTAVPAINSLMLGLLILLTLGTGWYFRSNYARHS